MKTIEIFLETGKKKTIAGAVDWPGWCRIGKDKDAAMAALIEYGPRYALAAKLGKVDFEPPEELSALKIVEKLEGTGTTDFGVPDKPLKLDERPVKPDDLERLAALLEGCWRALQKAARAAEGKHLRLGPRGGGRDLSKILEHVTGSSAGYQSRLMWKAPDNPDCDLNLARKSSLDALTHAVQNELPEVGPRGGKLWLPRYYARREAWHVLDHVWEIEDRIEGERET